MTIRTGKGGRYRYYACSMKARQFSAHSGTEVAELSLTLSRLAERTGRLESFVTSKEFELHRGFRELAP